jgi:tol-pal system protein YbgF
MTKRISSALLALLLLPTVAGAQNREHQQMAADVRMLQEQAQQLALTLAAQNQALTEALKAITARLDASNETVRKGFADQRLLVDELGDAVGVIRERSDDTNVRIGALREELEALRATVQALQQVALTPQAPAVPLDPNAPVPTTPAPAPPAPATPVPSTAGLSPQRLFEPARTDYFAGQYSSAILGFEAFLRAFPRSELADDAQFYIGESQSGQNQFADAVAAYNQVIQNYPGADKVPDSYYKRGLAQERLGQGDAARGSYETLIKSFPDSTAAQLARQNLDRLTRAQKPQ